MRCVKHFSVPRTNFKKDYLKSPLREKASNFITCKKIDLSTERLPELIAKSIVILRSFKKFLR